MNFTGPELLSLCQESLEKAGDSAVEVCARFVKRGCARFSIGDLSQHMELEEPSVMVRVANGLRVAEAQTTLLDRDAIVDAIEQAAKVARFVPETTLFPGFADGKDGIVANVVRSSQKTESCSAEERVERLRPAMESIRTARLVSAGMLETSRTSLAVATTYGCARHHDATVASFKVWALETPGAGGAAGYGGHMHRDIDAVEIEREAARAIRICTMSKNPTTLDAGSYDVVMEPAAVAELLEWLSVIAFGAGELEQETTPMRLGDRLTGEAIDFTEDPFDENSTGFGSPFDREGTARKRVELVKGGIANAFLFDRAHAARMGSVSTGSALFDGSGIGGSSLHMSGGNEASVDELIRGVKRGLYVCRLHYLNGLLDTRRAVMTGLTRDGCFLIEDGAITRPVGNLRFTESFTEALARVDGMTRERSAIHTWSETGATVVPAVRFRDFRFNGKSQSTYTAD